MKKIAWLIPLMDIEKSGGQKTIFDKVNYLAEFYNTDIYIGKTSGRNKINTVNEARDLIELKFGKFNKNIKCYLGYENPNINNNNYDALIATAAFTSKYVANSNVKNKIYFVQDLEYTFSPVNSNHIEAMQSYALGLKHVTIGKWLSHIISKNFKSDARSIIFGVNHYKYKVLSNIKKENAICFLFQPDKPRRLAELGIRALIKLKELNPDLIVYLYGSNDKRIQVPLNMVNLGLITEDECVNLYNKCKLGICFSPTNPSRIPFEMQACGLPCADMAGVNKNYDYYQNYNKLCCEAKPEILLLYINKLLKTDNMLKNHSELGINFVKDLSYERENIEFKKHVDNILENKWK